MKTAATMLFLGFAGLMCASAVPAQKSEKEGDKTTSKVKVIADIAYAKGDAADADKHQLDLYLPEGAKEFPVLFFVHGGGWTQGSRKKFDNLGKFFAGQGIAVVAPSYRLSPRVQHPAHVEDVAEAFAWTIENIDKYGGRKDRIFVSGHSAGGHLAALIATNDSYLKKHKLGPQNIRAVIPVSGVFAVGGEKKTDVWGKDPEGWKQASPLGNVTKNSPPFLILYAEKDAKMFHDQGKDLAEALKKQGVEASYREMEGRTHSTIIFDIHKDGDAVAQVMLDYIKKNK